jgi:hypothetical protein
MKVTLTPEMIFALQVALDVLSSSGVWTEYLTKDELETACKGIKQLKTNILNK